MILLLVLLVFLLLLAMSVPIAFALGVAATVYFVAADINLILLPQRLISSIDSWTLLAMPLFVMAGALMNTSGISERLVRLAGALVGHIRGGLAMVNVLDSMLFGGISGSAVSDVAALGSIVIPAMVKRGYSAPFSAALTASTASIAILIPPSIPLIFYGVVAGVSIGTLFAAGIVPGLVLGGIMMAMCYVFAIRFKFPTEGQFSWTKLLNALRYSILSIIMPVIVLGGILGGVFTPTEAGGVAVFYALFLGLVVYRELTWRHIYRALVETAILTSIVTILIATSSAFSWLLAHQRIPQSLTLFISSLNWSPLATLVVITLLLIGVGAIMHGDPIMFVVVPLLLPVVQALGIDLVLFGIIVTTTIAIGQQTPPVASVLFVASSISGVDIMKITRANIPFILAVILLLYLLVFFPEIALALPRLLRMM